MTAYDRLERVTPPAPGAPLPHERIGPYKIVQRIGEGGMGEVHMALDRSGRAVAIKVLRAHIAHDHQARTRLGREVETLSRVRDPRVASVIDADVLGPRPYVVTRYVDGPALDELVDEMGPLPPGALLRLARGTAEAIRAIHACGVVHRDIKPGNVLLEDGEPVLIDFGIAHLQDDVRHTVGGLVMGTPGYLSPELVEGAAITDATDWWGWAATITYAASGRPPFGRGRMDVVLSRVRAGDVDLDGVDPRLVPLLRASLSPNPARRPQADAVLAALEQFAQGRSATVPTPTPSPWDDSRRDRGDDSRGTAPIGSTQVVHERRTAPVAGPPPPSPARWSPPTPVTRRADPDPAAYGPEWLDEADEASEVAGDGYLVQRYDDPRIGLAMRSGLLATVAAAWLGALAAWPGISLAVLVVWSVLARAVDRSMSGLVLRRHDHGRRRSDVAWTVVASPWHLLVGAVATALSLLLPVAVALAGIYSAALLFAGTRGDELGPGTPVTLLAGGLLGLLTLWWGPGGASLRRGSRSVVRRLVPRGIPSRVVGVVFVVAGFVTAVIALTQGASLVWSPLSGNPFGG